jgi:lipopolysaccharide export system protein LptC
VKRPALLLLALAAVVSAGAADPAASPPARNWVLPLFSKEGQRTMTARGSAARMAGEHQIEVTDLNLTVFSAAVPNQVETIILSPAATFLPNDHLARGAQSMRFIRSDLEATGTRWVYDHARKKVSLDGRVRIVINAQLKDILK